MQDDYLFDKVHMDSNESIKSLYLDAECRANISNLRCMSIAAAILIVCNLLNEIGFFVISKGIMRLCCGVGVLLFLTPVFLMIGTRLFKSNAKPWERRSEFKYIITFFSFLGTLLACITLTHHTVLAMSVPILVVAQYRENSKLLPLAVMLSTVCVLGGVYGGFFFGYFDCNLLGIPFSLDNAMNMELRQTLATQKRMKELFMHYVVPREFVVLSLLTLATGISRRANDMLKRQAQLQEAAELEMAKTSRIQRQIIDGMATLIENRDARTGEHVKRTGYYVESIIREMQRLSVLPHYFTEEYASSIIKAAPLHDIGKIVVTDRILQKPGKLTPEEFEEIKLHSSEGERVIRNFLGNVEDESFIHIATEIACYHHERWDGNGYPCGHKGEKIPIAARIMAVADVFDALVSKRVYKDAIPPEQAYELIEQGNGTQFDPMVVKAFCSIREEIISSLNSNNTHSEAV